MASPAAAPRPITHTRVLKIAVPIVISNATVPILGAVDTGVVGQMGQAAPIGAVGIGAVVLTAFYWIFGFLRMGTVGLTSQALGAGDRAEADALLSRALMIGLSAGAVLVVAQTPLFWLGFLVSPASSEVEALARSYMSIRVWSAPAAIAIYGITGWLIAAERGTGVLVLQLWMNGLNIALDLVFVLGLGWGVEGVALATALAEWSGLALGLWLCRAALARPFWRDWPRVFAAERLARMASVNSDILIRSVILEAVFVSFLFYGAKLGDVPLAANQILLQFLHITAHALDGFAFAAESLVGNAVGRGSSARFRRSVALTAIWGGAWTVLAAVIFALAGGLLIDILAGGYLLGWEGGPHVTVSTENVGVRAEARTYLPWMVAAPVAGLAAWMLDGVFIGATRTRDMRNMMVVSGLVYLVALTILFPLFGNHGLWAALIVSFLARGATLGLKYPALERATARAA